MEEKQMTENIKCATVSKEESLERSLFSEEMEQIFHYCFRFKLNDTLTDLVRKNTKCPNHNYLITKRFEK